MKMTRDENKNKGIRYFYFDNIATLSNSENTEGLEEKNMIKKMSVMNEKKGKTCLTHVIIGFFNVR